MSTTVLPAVKATPLPAWASHRLVGDHRPHLDTWTCTRCPTGPSWPCAFARDHAVGIAAETPMAGLVWLRWCAGEATRVLDENADVVRARMVGWYLLLVARVDAYRGNRGPWWRQTRHR